MPMHLEIADRGWLNGLGTTRMNVNIEDAMHEKTCEGLVHDHDRRRM